MKDLQDAMVVQAHLERKAGERLKEHAEFVRAYQRAIAEDDRSMAQHRARMDALDAGIEKLVSGIGALLQRDLKGGSRPGEMT